MYNVSVKTVYFVRHGEGENNLHGPDQRYMIDEARLTARGREQAHTIAERAANLPIEALVSSPWARARETAECIRERVSVPVECSDLFIERRSPAALKGRLWNDEETQRLEKQWTTTLYSDDGSRFLDGENYEEIVSRARNALEYLESRPEARILVVTHGFFLRVIVGCVLMDDALRPEHLYLWRHGLKTRNTGVTVLLHDPEGASQVPSAPSDGKRLAWSLLTWNDHAHLG